MLISLCDNRSSSTPDRAATGLQNELQASVKGPKDPAAKEKSVGGLFWFVLVLISQNHLSASDLSGSS